MVSFLPFLNKAMKLRQIFLLNMFMFVLLLVWFYCNNEPIILFVVSSSFVVIVSLIASFLAVVLTLKAIKFIDPDPWNGPLFVKINYVFTCVLSAYIARAFALDFAWALINFILGK